MNWCCDSIKHMFDQRHDRTIFIFAETSVTNYESAVFWLGMRCVKQSDLARIKLFKIPEGMPVTINTRIPISHCPWCGAKLASYYRKTYGQMLDPELSKEFFEGIGATGQR